MTNVIESKVPAIETGKAVVFPCFNTTNSSTFMCVVLTKKLFGLLFSQLYLDNLY